jgi:GNAT superfamily N-acetyltransferase
MIPLTRYRRLDRAELDTVLDWAAAEGWNPGRADAEAFWTADPEAYWGIEHEGKLIGAGAIISYDGQAGFMGLFIVRPEWRGQGLGRKFWYFRRDELRQRLRDGAPIAMDGVFAMQAFYAKGGFVFTHRNLRMEGRGQAVQRLRIGFFKRSRRRPSASRSSSIRRRTIPPQSPSQPGMT